MLGVVSVFDKNIFHMENLPPYFEGDNFHIM
jgi:hypothetical protein